MIRSYVWLFGSVLLVGACSSSSDSGSGSPASSTAPGDNSSETNVPQSGSDEAAGPARLEIHLVDAPADEVTSVVVTVARVEAHVDQAWLELSHEQHTVDLLTLQNGTFESLGIGQLPAGHVGQLRLYLAEGGDNHVVTPDGLSHPLKVPSGEQSGIKILGGFDIKPCSTGVAIVDFDGKKSLFVHPLGAGHAEQEWILRPVIKIKTVVTGGECPDAGASDEAAVPTDPVDSGAIPTEPVDSGWQTEPVDSGPPPAEPLDAGNSVPVNPCQDVVCAEGQFCYNGVCAVPEPDIIR